jgi:molybdopterin-guanine dinucleotide biosynthesis protein B
VLTDAPAALPVATTLPVFDMADVATLAQYLLENSQAFDYQAPSHGH